MEFEQITKRLEWLDDQERKSKASVSEIGKSLTALETTVNAISKQIKTTYERSFGSWPRGRAPESIRSDPFKATHRIEQGFGRH